jgi:ribosomal-protein-alanine N-acetyltransferase
MLHLSFYPFPELESARLFLRRLKPSDSSMVYALRSNPQNMKYLPRPLLKNLGQAEDLIALMNKKIDNNTDINWAVVEKKSAKAIGFMGLYRSKPEHYSTELVYMLLPEFQNQGYTSEAVHKILEFAFKKIHFHRVEAIIDPLNDASKRVLEKNNFKREGLLRQNEFFGGRFWDSEVYSILDFEFELTK